MQPHFSAVVIGGLICLALQVFFALLGSAIGLSVLQTDFTGVSRTWEISTFIYLGLTLFASFMAGGYAAARLANQRFRIATFLHGLGMWAMVALVLVFLIGNVAFSLMGNLLKEAGLGAGAVSATASLMRELKDMNPRLVSNIKLTKGRIVTVLEVNKQAPHTIKGIVKSAQKDIKAAAKPLTKDSEIKAEIKDVAQDVKSITAKSGLIASLTLLVTAVASGFGAFLARRPFIPPSAASSQEAPERKVA